MIVPIDPIVNVLSRYQRAGEYVFHSTSPECVASIRANGIRHDTGLETDSADIINILDELGYTDPFPFDRREATYCYVDAEYVTETLNSETDDASVLNTDKAIIVIDATVIDAPMYLADMSVITDLIDYRYAGPEIMLHADTPEEVIELYKESITEVESPETIASTTEGLDHTQTELVVDGDIPPKAIADIYRRTSTDTTETVSNQ